MSPRCHLDRVVLGVMAAMLLACLAFAAGQGFALDLPRAVPAALIVIALLVAHRRLYQSDRPRAAAAACALLQMTLFTLLGVVLAYTVASHAEPFWDAELAAADRALGFDWPALLALLDRAPLLVWLLGLTYHGLSVQLVVTILLLAWQRRVGTLRLMVLAAMLSGFVTILTSAVMPAAGNLFDPAAYRHLWPSIAWLERDLVAGLRDGTGRVLDLTQPMGIVSFPSYHATLAALFAWAARQLPRWRAALTGWAVLTIVATPVFGGHYAIEVIVGLALAPAAILSARAIASARADLGERRTTRFEGRPRYGPA